VPDYAIHPDICRFLLASDHPQHNGAIVDESNKEQEGSDQPPNLIGIFLIVTIGKSCVR
jgi:hypothetical protein